MYTRIKLRSEQHIKKHSKIITYILILVLFSFCSAVAITGGMGLAYYHRLKKELPDISSLLKEYKPSLITKIYADNGDQLAEFYIEKRIPVPLQEIPTNLKQAIIAVEDANFYSHNGIDILGIIRAFWSNVKAKRVVEGASTITQQLIRSVMLTRKKHLLRKIKEVLLALKLEESYSKDEILELYLNQIYFGHGAYGVESASMLYFNKTCRDLDILEAAMLAGLPQAPNRYSPYRNPNEAVKRRNHVLKRMFEESFIDKNDYSHLINSPIILRPSQKKNTIAPYFVEYIRQYLEDLYGSEMLFRGGLKIYTTLDIRLQKIAEKAFEKGIRALDKRQGFRPYVEEKPAEDLYSPLYFPKDDEEIKIGQVLKGVVNQISEDNVIVLVNEYIGNLNIKNMSWTKVSHPSEILNVDDKILVKILDINESVDNKILDLALEQNPEVEGALIALDPSTGFIRAMIGGTDFNKTKFNRAIQARRQPGSAFKPIIYAAAIENGFTPADVFIDSPIIYEEDENKEQKEWKPVNYHEKFYGPTTLRSALEQSRNIVTIKLLEKIGVNKAIEMAQRLNIKSPLASDLSIALGSSGVSVLEMSLAYSVFANQGKICEPIFIKMILDNSGEILLQNEIKSETVISPQVAFIMTNLLKGVVEHGTGWRARRLDRPVAGKTGTTNKYHDAWFIGYSPELLTSIWVGFDELKSLGKLETGSKAACPIWVDFMEEALSETPVKNFTVPEGINFVSIDAKSGLLATEDCEKIIVESFIEGTEPSEYSNPYKPSADQFYKIDASLEEEENIQRDKIEDNKNEEQQVEEEEPPYYYSD